MSKTNNACYSSSPWKIGGPESGRCVGVACLQTDLFFARNHDYGRKGRCYPKKSIETNLSTETTQSGFNDFCFHLGRITRLTMFQV